MKTSELTGAALDWAVAKCEGLDYWHPEIGPSQPEYSTDWAQGGPIIDKTGICLSSDHEDAGEGWIAYVPNRGGECWGDTALVAAMRCYVARRLGDKVEVPEELSA